MCPLSDHFAQRKLALWTQGSSAWGHQGQASAISQAPRMNLVDTLRTSFDFIKQHDHSPCGGPSGGPGTRGHSHLSQRHLPLPQPLLETEASQLPTNPLPPHQVNQEEDHRQDHVTDGNVS